jgi:hypothetical protein
MLEADMQQYFGKRSIWLEKWSVLERVERWQGGWDMQACKPLPSGSVVYYGPRGYVTAPLLLGLKRKWLREPM